MDVKPTAEFLRDARTMIGVVEDRLRELATERDQLKAELAKLQAEREPRDNGDGTETRLLPVTYPRGLDVIEARAIKPGDRHMALGGARAANGVSSPHCIYLILRPTPKPPEPVTWEAPLVDGEWIAGERSFRKERPDLFAYEWEHLGSVFRGLRKPDRLGTYQFKEGVGTLIQEAGNE